MIFMFCEPYPEFQEWLEANGHTVVDRNRREYGKVYMDDIRYPMKRLALECHADVVVIPELWGDDQIGYSKEQTQAAQQRATVLAFSSPFNTWKGAGNCRARPHNCSVTVYTDEYAAEAHARSTGRAVFFQGNFQPVLDAVTHHRSRQRYAVNSRSRAWR